MNERSANAKPVDLKFTRSSGAVGIEGRYDPRSDAAMAGIVTVQFTAMLAGSEGDPIDRLRVTERMVAADVLHRLNAYESLIAERDSLRERLGIRASRPTSSGFSTAELMNDNC